MNKRHLKRIGMPKSWPVKRKGITFIARPRPGAHKLKDCVTISVVLKDILKLAKTSTEVKRILNSNSLLVDNKIRTEPRFSLGIMDIITIENNHYRLILNEKGKFELLKIKKEEAQEKISKITGKKILPKKKIQINLYDGKNIIVEKDSYKTGDSIIVSGNKINKHLKFEKGATIYITGGKHIGEIGKLEEVKTHKGITKDTIILIIGKNKVETSKDYAYVIENESNARNKD